MKILLAVVILASLSSALLLGVAVGDTQKKISDQQAEINTLTEANNHLRKIVGDKNEYIEAGCHGRYQGED